MTYAYSHLPDRLLRVTTEVADIAAPGLMMKVTGGEESEGRRGKGKALARSVLEYGLRPRLRHRARARAIAGALHPLGSHTPRHTACIPKLDDTGILSPGLPSPIGRSIPLLVGGEATRSSLLLTPTTQMPRLKLAIHHVFYCSPYSLLLSRANYIPKSTPCCQY